MPEDVAKQIMEMIEANVSVIPITGCWMWMRSIATHAMVTWGPWRTWNGEKTPFGPGWRCKVAHRMALSAHQKRYLIGGSVDHLCEHPWCVNPSHLEWVTQRENTVRSQHHRRVSKKRIQMGLPAQAPVPGIAPSKHMTF